MGPLYPGSILSMTADAADRLLHMDSGDAALLYLYLLRKGTANGLRWPQERIEKAMEALVSQGLAKKESMPSAPPPAPEPDLPPEYTVTDITNALGDGKSSFSGLTDEVERRLGKRLSTNDLKILYTIYDHLALPAEVILMLITWCSEEMERKYGPGRKPFLAQIRKEAFAWARRGIDTAEAAEEHLRKMTLLRSREGEVLRMLDIQPRPLVERERAYIEAWQDMGFGDDILREAYERTIMKKQSMDWSYMNGILRRWHEKGLHSLAAIQGENGPNHGNRPQPGAAPADDRRAREDMERMRRLMEQMKEEEG